jgi:hypothetical protein
MLTVNVLVGGRGVWKMLFQKDAKWCILLHFGYKICVVKTLSIAEFANIVGPDRQNFIRSGIFNMMKEAIMWQKQKKGETGTSTATSKPENKQLKTSFIWK